MPGILEYYRTAYQTFPSMETNAKGFRLPYKQIELQLASGIATILLLLLVYIKSSSEHNNFKYNIPGKPGGM